MTTLVDVLTSAATLGATLFEGANNRRFDAKVRAAFTTDALMIVSATQALAISPAHGQDSAAYDPVKQEVEEALTAMRAAAPGDPATIHAARLEAVQAAEALKRATVKPGISVL